jgi:hypothetical protein
MNEHDLKTESERRDKLEKAIREAFRNEEVEVLDLSLLLSIKRAIKHGE